MHLCNYLLILFQKTILPCFYVLIVSETCVKLLCFAFDGLDVSLQEFLEDRYPRLQYLFESTVHVDRFVLVTETKLISTIMTACSRLARGRISEMRLT